MSIFNIAKKTGLSEAAVEPKPDECHVCYKPFTLAHAMSTETVTCPNGHICCQRHHLERVRAIYQEGNPSAFAGGEDGSGTAQHCFMCRCDMKDDLFSPSYFRCLAVLQLIEIPKMYQKKGHNITPEHPLDMMKKVGSMKEWAEIKSTNCVGR